MEPKSILSWNVNGFRKKREVIQELIKRISPDYVCLQETRLADSIHLPCIDEYHGYWNNANKSGYSGTAILCKEEPLSVSFGMPLSIDNEGRVITLETSRYYLVNTYMPAINDDYHSLQRRLTFDRGFINHIEELLIKKPIIICGDINVPLTSMDLSDDLNSFHYQEILREYKKSILKILLMGVVDVWRYFNPGKRENTWVPYGMRNSDDKIGMRMDYVFTSSQLLDRITSISIKHRIQISDHRPIIVSLRDINDDNKVDVGHLGRFVSDL